ncbi:MAG TPA: aminoglycoside adenylyltransferase domain-containing protein [Longimicrobiales bacterium]|nr:aminoglycoside adenylyltransferase domain-containing protein [Longimicrobiales bacterium]
MSKAFAPSDAGAPVVDPVSAYLDAVRNILSQQDGYVATVVVGSLASEDFDPARSDLDLIPLYEAPLTREEKVRITSRLRHRALPCPAHGLDLVAYVRAEVRGPSPAPTLEFSISSGATWKDDISFDEVYPGGLIDLAAARQFGSTLEGVPVASLVGPVDPDQVLAEIRRSLNWHLDKIHDPFHDPLGSNAVLNACRGLHFQRTGALVSKSAGAAGFLDGVHGDLVRRALETRTSMFADPLPKAEVVAFVGEAAARCDP